ncbi:exonuclease domain-containing protein [Sinomicrobium weinanense]|uniref:GIY-YIG nuclease family protein n=1 Tax=Sinomicrobium weinanense TaxID=2842200 RepID=A0A926Q3J6_9FLAO|nr:exonuclease domain-containing protein [Sinomicrobium weinanense]MBC9797004.1 GIY-YIG nuclease family protein [Sinomicrobium weinanense]MBU3123298.1 GIY-YIG nuclease family protein [Sinomicrobium weinanense]
MYAIVDVETTGLGGDANRITEIAIAVHDGNVLLEEFHSLVNPGTHISPYVTGLTGIDNDMVMDAPAFEDIADTIQNLTEDKVFVAHSVNFDYNVIRKEFQRIGQDFRRKKLCTVRLSRQIFPGLRSYSLGRLCRHLDIEIQDRHRAKGDTDATVILFEKLLKNDAKDVFARQLHQRSREFTLPPLLSKEVFDKLPATPGVYYFLDEKGKVIYVGKAINIKKRVLGHFYDKTSKEIALARETAHIDCEETGNELLALIRESTQIKHLFPKYNTAQKRPVKGYGIVCYTDRQGILHLGYNRLRHTPDPLKIYYTTTECISFLEQVCEAYELCPKYTQLQTNVLHCSHYKLKSCKGICRGTEETGTYNKRVKEAINHIQAVQDNFIIVERGRTPEENALIQITGGNYAGYGYISKEETIDSYREFQDFISPQKHNPDIKQIITSYLAKSHNHRIITEGDTAMSLHR